MALALLLLSTLQASAQRYHTRIYTETDGLASSAVHDVTQGLDGTMWFATRFGVSSYDGAHWTTYDLRDGLPNIDQRRILCGPDGRIWSVSVTCAAAVFENGVWEALPVPEVSEYEMFPVVAVAPSDGGTVLLIATRVDGLHYYTGSAWHTMDLPGDPDPRIRDITVHNGRVFLASESGVLTLNPDNLLAGAAFSTEIPRRRTLALAPDPATGTLWIAADDHVARVRPGGYELVRDDLSIELGRVVDFLYCEPDRFGGLYIGNPIAMYRLDTEGIEQLDVGSGMSGAGTNSFFRDREGNTWIATMRGATRISSLRFANYSREQGLQDNEVSSIIERDNGDMVLGHPAGFTILGAKSHTITLTPLTETRVLDMTLDPDGAVLAAVYDYGLARINGRNNLTWVPLDETNDEKVTSVMTDRNNRIWVTTFNRTFIGINGRFAPSEYGVHPPEQEAYLRRIFEASDGTIYIVSSLGVYRIRPDGYDRIAASRPGHANQVYAFHEDTDGTIWLGTMAGLCFLKYDAIIPVEDPRIRINRPVYFIVKDGGGQLWFGTDHGIMRWNGKSLKLFTTEDGLVGRETNRAAGWLDSRDQLWIGMDNGVSIYRPRFDIPAGVPPVVRLNDVDINGDLYPLGDKLELGPGSNTLVFRFDAMSFVDERKVRFSAWLEGFDEEWLEGFYAPGREIRYTNLSPGEYRFHLRASSAEGVWSESVSSGPIVIDAPFRQKPQFLIAVIMTLAITVMVTVGFVVQRRYARRLEKEVRERMDEMRMVEAELNKAQRIETLGLLAGGIAHDFNNLLTVLTGNLGLIAESPRTDPREKTNAMEALSAAQRARTLTRQLLTFSRGGAPVRRPTRIEAVIRETAYHTLGTTVDCRIDLPDNLLIVDVDAGQISQAMNHLLVNARDAIPDDGVIHITARNHTAPPRPELRPGQYVEVEIVDDGPGIDPGDTDRIFDPYFTTRDGHTGMGLPTSYSIVKRHGGLLVVDSIPGACTTCRMYVPASLEQTLPPDAEEFKAGSRPGRILVMDDERAIRNLVGKALQREGHAVVLASDGEEALALYIQHMEEGRGIDLVVLDLMVPGGMGGRDTIRFLQQTDPDVRAIVASGYSDDPVVAEYQRYGFCGCILKPFTTEDLLNAVRSALAASTES
jgi:signal transduction histidine kinase/ligand-binding sensor domain-containing protein/CheY-like chemotaxis protein